MNSKARRDFNRYENPWKEKSLLGRKKRICHLKMIDIQAEVVCSPIRASCQGQPFMKAHECNDPYRSPIIDPIHAGAIEILDVSPSNMFSRRMKACDEGLGRII